MKLKGRFKKANERKRFGKMQKNKKSNNELLNNLDYVLINLDKAIKEANYLDDVIYMELSKKQIINYLNSVYEEIKLWKDNFKNNNYNFIINNYKKIEATISELELCLADYESIFNMNGISYSIYQIGKYLDDIKKGDNIEK